MTAKLSFQVQSPPNMPSTADMPYSATKQKPSATTNPPQLRLKPARQDHLVLSSVSISRLMGTRALKASTTQRGKAHRKLKYAVTGRYSKKSDHAASLNAACRRMAPARMLTNQTPTARSHRNVRGTLAASTLNSR